MRTSGGAGARTILALLGVCLLGAAAPLPQPDPPRDGEAVGDDATARLLWMREEQGTPTADFRRRLMQERTHRADLDKNARSLASPDATGPTQPVWVPIGPEGADYEQNGYPTGYVRDSGRVRRILPHPTDPDTVYLLTSGGGLWVTHSFTASSTTWTPLTDAQPTLGGGAIAFGRTPGVLYLGTGDPFDVINIGGSMVKSIDGGQTWSAPVDLGNALSVRDLLVDTSGPQDIIVAATDDGVYRSADSGASYTRIQGGPGELLQGNVIWSLARTSAGIVASAQPCPFTPATRCGTTGALYLSADLGATWTSIPSGGIFVGAGRTTLAVGAPGDAVVYAFAENAAASDQLDLFRSTNGGLNWTALGINSQVPANSNSDNPNMDLMRGQSWYNQMILVDPRDASRNTVYLGGQLGSARTTDGGATWSLLTNWLPFYRFPLPYVHADFHAAALGLAGVPTLMFGCDGGLFVSQDGGATFSSDKNNGLQTFLTYSLTSTPSYPETVIAGFQDNGSRVRKGTSKIYNQSYGGDGTGNGWSQKNAGMSVVSVPGSSYGINLTGQVPDVIASFIPWFGASDGTFVVPVVFPAPGLDPTERIFYSETAKRLLKFDFNPSPPTVTNFGQISSSSSLTFRASAHAIGIDPNNLSYIGVPLSSGHVDWTLNGGASYTDVVMNSLVPGFQSNVQSFTWLDDLTMIVTSVAPLPGAIRVVKSVDQGATWARADSGLPDVQVERVIADPGDPSHQALYAATYAGVYRSPDRGATWAPYGTGLPNVPVRDIYASPDGSFLRVGTYGRGIWELPLLSYAGAALTDDLISCDHDGALDNGETARLTISLRNDGAATLSQISGTVGCTNGAVSFPGGNAVVFPSAAAGATVSASVPVKLLGASGIQRLDFSVAFGDPALGMPAPIAGTASFRANVDEVPNSSANDDVEAATTAWTASGTTAVVPDIFNWKRIALSPMEHRWLGIDSNLPSDEALVSPPLNVGPGDFRVSFEQRYDFDFSGGNFPVYYDGMVVELSADNGATWTDVGAFASPGYTQLIATGGQNVLEGRLAWAGYTTNYPTPFIPTVVDLGTTYAGQTVRIRFRIGTDELSYGPGAEIRNITTTGLLNTPFTALVPDRGLCPPPGEVQNQAWTSATTMTWSHEPSLGTYEVYRDLIANLPGSFGTCFQSGLPTESVTDAGTPPLGKGWFYIVTARNNLGQEGTKGFQSSGSERPNPAPCP